MERISQTVSKAIETATPATPGKPAVTVPPRRAIELLAQFQIQSNPTRALMVTECAEFCRELQERRERRWLTLLGPSGIGKTLLARLVYRFVKERGCLFRIEGPCSAVVQSHRCLWVNWREACADMKKGDFTIVEELCIPPTRENRDHHIWFAVIDDLGSGDESEKSYLRGNLERIVDARLKTWTLWTSNLLLDQISETLDRRIASRMLRDGNRVIEATDIPDWNLQ